MTVTNYQLQTDSSREAPNVRIVVSYEKIYNPDGLLGILRTTRLGRFYRKYCKRFAPLHSATQWVWRAFFPYFYNYFYIPFSKGKIKKKPLIKLHDYASSHSVDVFKIKTHELVATPLPKTFPPEERNKLIPPHESYVFQETYVSVIRNATIYGSTSLIAAETEVLCHDLFDPRRDYTSEELHGKILFNPDKMEIRCLFNDDSPECIGSAATFVDACAQNYAHWLTEVLPRIAVFCSQENFNEVPIVVNGGLHENIMESLMRVVGPSREVITLPADRAMIVDTLYVTSMVGYVPFGRRRNSLEGHSHGIFSPAALKTMRNRLHSHFYENSVASRAPVSPERIFLRRNSGVRILKNALEIESFLLDRGFFVVEPERLTFAEQFELFSRAKTIIGPTGAAFANILFAQSGTNIVILMGRHDDNCYWYWQNIACATGNTVVYGLSDHKSREIHSDYEVSVETLAAIIDDIE